MKLCLNEPISSDAGCAIVPCGDKCAIGVVVKGLVDPVAETEKLIKKKALAEKACKKLEEAMMKPIYTEKVPEAIRLADQAKVDAYRGDIQAIEKAIQMYAAMM